MNLINMQLRCITWSDLIATGNGLFMLKSFEESSVQESECLLRLLSVKSDSWKW